MTASPPPFPFELKRIECGAVTLNVATSGHGPPIIFLHGFPEHWRAFAPMMQMLSDQFTCIAPDQRGYGASDRPTTTSAYHIDHLADDIAGLVSALGVGKVDIVGHDWGGLVAWHLASRHPTLLRRMVIFNAPHPLCLQNALATDPLQRDASTYAKHFAEPKSHEALIAKGSAALWDGFFGFDQSQGWLNEDDKAEQIIAWEQVGAWEAILNWYRAADFDYCGDPAAVRLRPHPIQTPLLLVWGDNDRLFVPSVLLGTHDIAPNCQIKIIEGGGHCVFREDLTSCSTYVRNFLMDEPITEV